VDRVSSARPPDFILPRSGYNQALPWPRYLDELLLLFIPPPSPCRRVATDVFSPPSFFSPPQSSLMCGHFPISREKPAMLPLRPLATLLQPAAAAVVGAAAGEPPRFVLSSREPPSPAHGSVLAINAAGSGGAGAEALGASAHARRYSARRRILRRLHRSFTFSTFAVDRVVAHARASMCRGLLFREVCCCTALCFCFAVG
jgi:hypothetical protein